MMSDLEELKLKVEMARIHMEASNKYGFTQDPVAWARAQDEQKQAIERYNSALKGESNAIRR